MNIRDIANLCGVSPSTVSKVLHNKDEEISAETRRKVLAVIKEYQYVPYSKVLNSAPAKSSLIGVLISSGSGEERAFVNAVETEMADRGYSIILCNTRGSLEKARKYQHILETKNVEGILFLFQEKETVEACKAPAAAVWKGRVKSQNPLVADFYYEENRAEYLAVKYLLENSHRKIGYILQGEGEECQGYTQALQEYDLTPNPRYIFRGSSLEEINRVDISQCLNMDVTAVLCGSGQIAARVYGRLRERGERIPEDMSVAVLGGGEMPELLFPKPAAVCVSMESTGQKAAAALVDMLEERKSAYQCGQRLEAEVFAGESVKPPGERKQGGKLVVVGSMNMDCSISVPSIPSDGETLIASNIITMSGGKGGNQAVGAGKLGGFVFMLGCLGNDADGKEIYDSLAGNGVRMDGVEFDRSMPTGKAYINVAPDGESTIVVYPGANGRLDRSIIKKHRQIFKGAKFCLLSLEIPQDTVEYTMKECEKRGVGVIVKPSPARGLREELFGKIEYFVPNEKELRYLVPGNMTIEEKAELLLKKGVKNVIVTLGRNGCYLRNEKYSRYFPAADFNSVDTTGAADAFVSALAVCLSEGNGLIYAIGFATYAACISITRYGVQSAMVDRAGLEVYKDEILSRYPMENES